MNVWQRKIDDQRSVFQRVLPPKNALQTKRPVFYSPGEFTGRGSEAHLHKRKAEILRFRVKRELSSNLPPKRKNRPEDRSAENQENGRGDWIRTSDLYVPNVALQPDWATPRLHKTLFNITPFHDFSSRISRKIAYIPDLSMASVFFRFIFRHFLEQTANFSEIFSKASLSKT